MRTYLTLSAILLGFSSLAYAESLIKEECTENTCTYTCDKTVDFRGRDLSVSKATLNKFDNFNCCYAYQSSETHVWDYCPPAGQVNVKKTLKTMKCKVDKKSYQLNCTKK